MSKLYDAIIAGAGPVGLMLACELGMTGASVLVLESEPSRESPWKSWPLGVRGLNTGSVEAIYRRGLLNKLSESSERPLAPTKKPEFQFAGHFAGIMLDMNKLDLSHWKYRLPGPALMPSPTTIELVEGVLTERAESLGVTILRGNGITKLLAQDDHSVTVEAGDKETFQGRWLVGCDGGRSVVRNAAGFGFVGTDPTFTAYSTKCDLDPPEKLTPGFQVTKTGMYIFMRPDCLHLLDFNSAAFDRKEKITQEHLQAVLNHVTGTTDVKISAVHLASTYTDRCKQASSYRKGRILLAGDAAHIHSPLGAQGMNLGLGDAMNLGWKLAATIRQESEKGEGPVDLALLDTYESERYPIATWVLEWTRAQVSTLQPNPYGVATRTLVRELIDTTDGTNLLIDRVWGLSLRYRLGEDEAHAHPLVGCSAPDIELRDGSRLGPKLESGRGLLIDFTDDLTLKDLIVGGKYEARVDYLAIGAEKTCDLRALLIRPDGVVAWLAEGGVEPDLDAAKAALKQWFGN